MERGKLVGKIWDWNKIENPTELGENTMVLISKFHTGRKIIYYHELQIMR